MFSSDIFIIRPKFDDCEVPEELKSIQYVKYYTKNGFQKLEKAIKQSYRVKKNNLNVSAENSSTPLPLKKQMD